MLLYFSQTDVPHDHDARQLELLKQYRDSLKQDTLYSTFSDRDTFRRLVTKHLAKTINELAQELLGAHPDQKGEARLSMPEEIQLRVDAMNVSARITESYSDTFSVLLTNESDETVNVRDHQTA